MHQFKIMTRLLYCIVFAAGEYDGLDWVSSIGSSKMDPCTTLRSYNTNVLCSDVYRLCRMNIDESLCRVISQIITDDNEVLESVINVFGLIQFCILHSR